jgi:hypothetical protein
MLSDCNDCSDLKIDSVRKMFALPASFADADAGKMKDENAATSLSLTRQLCCRKQRETFVDVG